MKPFDAYLADPAFSSVCNPEAALPSFLKEPRDARFRFDVESGRLLEARCFVKDADGRERPVTVKYTRSRSWKCTVGAPL